MSEYISIYQPTCETERIKEIKKHIKKYDFDYLYGEFDFANNETIINAYFDENDQLNIEYLTTE